jgi:hypothetical protein
MTREKLSIILIGEFRDVENFCGNNQPCQNQSFCAEKAAFS